MQSWDAVTLHRNLTHFASPYAFKGHQSLGHHQAEPTLVALLGPFDSPPSNGNMLLRTCVRA